MITAQDLARHLPSSLSTDSPVVGGVLEFYADAVSTASTDVALALEQMSMATASDNWLDEWGEYFGIPRFPEEPDADYTPRLIIEIIRPRSNNIAIANAIALAAGGLQADVVDAPMAEINISAKRNGSFSFNGLQSRALLTQKHYGQFDVNTDFDLLSAESISALTGRIQAVVANFKAAGTKLRQIQLSGSLSDAAPFSATDLTGLSVQHAPIEDAYWGPRSLHDGTLLRGAILQTTYSGAYQRNGSLSRVGWVLSSASLTLYGQDVDPLQVSAFSRADFQDEFGVPLAYSGDWLRTGLHVRTGARQIAMDNASISITRSIRRDGRHLRGSRRDGSISYNLPSRMHNTVFYAGLTSWTESV